MRKLIALASLLIFVFLVLFIVSKPHPTELPVEFVSELEGEKNEVLTVCVLREDGKLVLIDVEKRNEENVYLYALKLYDHYRNSLPPKYTTPLKGNFEVKKLEKKGRTVSIELDFLFLEENLKSFLTALMWTYQQLGIDSVNVKAGREEYKLEKNETVNIMRESLKPTRKQTIQFWEGEAILPVTYYHEMDETAFLIEKFLERFPEVSYTFSDHAGFLILEIIDPRFEITTITIENLAFNLENLGLYRDIVILKNGILVYNN